MKKILICIIAIIIIGTGIVYGIMMTNKNGEKPKEENIEINKVSELVTDECIEEKETNANEEKISPNSFITYKKYYKKCKHTINEYNNVPENLINKTEEEIKSIYKEWNIEKFSKSEIILSREYEGECGQHYILKNDEGKISIYLINENNEEILYEKTEISIEYLPETDKEKLQNGIRANGNEELNKILEDFE